MRLDGGVPFRYPHLCPLGRTFVLYAAMPTERVDGGIEGLQLLEPLAVAQSRFGVTITPIWGIHLTGVVTSPRSVLPRPL